MWKLLVNSVKISMKKKIMKALETIKQQYTQRLGTTPMQRWRRGVVFSRVEMVREVLSEQLK